MMAEHDLKNASQQVVEKRREGKNVIGKQALGNSSGSAGRYTDRDR